MKKFCWTKLAAGMILTVILAGCASPSPTPAALPTSALPTPVSNTSSSTADSVTASAVVAPAQISQLGFLISAPVKEVNIKEGDKVNQGQTLVVLDTPQLNLSVEAAQAAFSSAQSKAIIRSYQHKEYIDGKVYYLSGPPELRQIANIQVVQAQAALDIAQATLAQGSLTAPYDGTVVSLDIVPGQLIQPGQIAAVIGDLNHLQIETTDLSERDIASVQIGQTATIHIKALNQDFAGKVTAIAPMATKYNADWVYKVTIEFDKQPQNLLWGMSADVTIQTK